MSAYACATNKSHVEIFSSGRTHTRIGDEANYYCLFDSLTRMHACMHAINTEDCRAAKFRKELWINVLTC